MGSSAATSLAKTNAELQKLVSSYKAHGPTGALLPSLSAAMVALAVPMRSRSYRRAFSENYITLLGGQMYRSEIFVAATSQEPELWVNGEVHQISAGTLGRGLVLKNCFLDVCDVLNESAHRGRFPVSRLRAALTAFDSIWVDFEEAYITELIRIEDLSRQPLADAIALEFRLLDLEGGRAGEPRAEPRVEAGFRSDSFSSSSSSSSSHGSLTTRPAAPRHAQKTHAELLQLALSAAQGTPRREVLELLVRQLAVLNGCANRRGKGRKDLHIEVLEVAADLFLSEGVPAATDTNKVRETLAFAVLEAFLELRRYLYRTSQHMVMIDPQLANNPELQARLMAWESAWELGNDFLVQPDLRKAFCGIAVETAGLQEYHPDFAKLVEDQDAELFLILPRLVLLSGLWDPEHRALARSFAEGWELESLSDELLTLSLLFPGSQLDFWKLLMSKALEGPGSVADQEFSALLEKFLLKLEALSMQLQRQDPKRWNRCCQLLLQSIAAAMAAPVRVLSL